MPNYLHRTTRQYLRSVSTPDLQEPVANYIQDPDVSAVIGFPNRYWIITGDVVTLMDQAARDVVDADLNTARLNSIADGLDQTQTILKAFAEVLLDELNSRAATSNSILAAIDGANNLGSLKAAVTLISNTPQRTLAQLKSAVRGKL